MFIILQYQLSDSLPSSYFLRLSTICLVMMLFFAPSPLNADQNLKGLLKEQPDDQPWSINADTMSFDRPSSLYIGTGHVVIARGNTRLTAEKVTFDPDAMIAKAQGDVTLTTEKDRLTCQRMELDLKSETGTIHHGSVFLSEGHFYIRGDKIEKRGEQSYFADRATITTCDGDRPDWRLTTRNLKVTIEGYGTATHTTLWAKSLPVLYSPFLAFPVKIKRQTGLLPPHFGISKRKGLSLEQPIFWAINDQSDMTFNYNYMEKRGNQYGMEFRYLLSPETNGMLMFDWLDDAKVDDGIGDDSDWGYQDTPTDYLRPNSERYWFRMKHNQFLGAGYRAKLDLDIVSDQDYLPEFKSTYTGFNRSREAFENFFGRGIDDYTDITRTNTFNISKTWVNYNLNAGVLWGDYVADYTKNPNYMISSDNPTEKVRDITVQYLPTVDFDSSKHRLAATPFHWALESQYAYLYREETDGPNSITDSHRWDAYPRISLPFNWGNYLNIEPSAGMRETVWYATEKDRQVDNEDPEVDKINEFQNRHLWDARLDLSNVFYRIFKTKLGAIDRIKHDIKPKVTYQYLPRVDQDEYPHFDSADRIASMNLITYSLTNILTYRKQMPRATGRENAAPVTQSSLYRQFFRFHIQQSYDLSDGKDPYNDLQYNVDGDNTINDYPFSTIYAELEFTPQNFFSLDTDANWSVYDGRFRTGNLALNLWDQREDRLMFEYRFAEQTAVVDDNGNTEVSSFYTTANLKVTSRLSLYGLWERDLHTDTEIEYGGGLVYSAQCWSIEASHTVEGRDHRYFFTIDLYGLGKIGT